MSKNNNISRKITLFWKSRFFAHIPEKNISPKISRKECFQRSLSMKKLVFVHMSKTINISRKIMLIWDHFEKVIFYPYTEKINISRKLRFLISLESRLLSISPYFCKNQYFAEKLFILESFWKNRYFHKSVKSIFKILLVSFWKILPHYCLLLWINSLDFYKNTIFLQVWYAQRFE